MLGPGYYWFYTLSKDGTYLQSENKLDICYYNNGLLTFLGWEISVEYNPDQYVLVQIIKYDPEYDIY